MLPNYPLVHNIRVSTKIFDKRPVLTLVLPRAKIVDEMADYLLFDRVVSLAYIVIKHDLTLDTGFASFRSSHVSSDKAN